jgi:hypothetical protein
VVVHDSREEFPLTSVAAAHVEAPGRGDDRRPAANAHIAPRAGGGAWLQYWLYYPAQDQDRGVVRTGRHEGDWELAQIRVDPGGRPREVVYAQHRGGERCAWSEVERRGGYPVVYAAHGSTGQTRHATVRRDATASTNATRRRRCWARAPRPR